MNKPSWVDVFSNENVTYGFDNIGMWFQGDANGLTYPVRTNFDIPQNETCTVIFTFIHDSFCSDQGICIFNSEIEPIWEWGPQETRIAFQMNCPFLELDGQGENDDTSEPVLVEGNTYTGRFVYNPLEGTVLGEVYDGTSVSGEPIASVSLNETLPDGNYRVGFAADSDGTEGSEESFKSYFTFFSVNGRESNRTTTNNHCPTCPTHEGIKCYVNSSCKCSKWKFISAGTNGAYVPAITVCSQKL